MNAQVQENYPTASTLRHAYALMRNLQGHQHWWPGETPFEVCIGAILTQNTSWTNVERALANLKHAQVLTPARLFDLPNARLAELIRPAGCSNVKVRRVRAFLRVLIEAHGGELARLFAGTISLVRERLLAIHGIGPETADCLLLYAGGHPIFVIDAYTKRIFTRHGWCRPNPGYDELQNMCQSSLGQNGWNETLDYCQDYHAQLVQVGKKYCRPRQARCDQCPLRALLPATP